jgi:hypothetical protein
MVTLGRNYWTMAFVHIDWLVSMGPRILVHRGPKRAVGLHIRSSMGRARLRPTPALLDTASRIALLHWSLPTGVAHMRQVTALHKSG